MDGSPSPLLDSERSRLDGRNISVGARRSRMAALAKRYRGILLCVVLPTLLSAIYYFGVAADQYQSEAEFVIYSSHGAGVSTGGLTQLLGLGASGASQQSETYSVIDYMQSHDAVDALQKDLNLVAMFRDPQADPLSRLWYAHPSTERLVRYYDNMVTVNFDQDTGITSLKVRAFTPQDAYNIANTLLTLGEQKVNTYNDRINADTVKVAQHEVDLAVKRIQDDDLAITNFREQHGDLNPVSSGAAEMELIAKLQAELTQSQAELAQFSQLSPTSPQVVAIKNRIAAVQAQIQSLNGNLTGQHGALAPVLAKYEDLTLSLKFAQTAYTDAEAALATAREDAIKQQLFLIRVVDPNMPETSLFPHRFAIVLTIFLSLFVFYGIAWLFVAGVKEHAI